MMLMLLFQLDKLKYSLPPINATQVKSIVHQLVNATEGPMSAADLSASIDVMLRLTLLYRSRRRSL